MKHFLLASAAAVALLAAPFALAQYPEPAPASPPAYTMPQTEPGYALPQNDPAYTTPAPQTAPSTSAPSMTAPSATAEPYIAPSAAAPESAYDTPNVAAAQPGDPQTTAQADQGFEAQTAQTDQSYPSAQLETAQSYAASADMTALEEHARDAGMASLPMSAAEVCAPRSIDFEQTRLNNDARLQLVNAVDRASVCEMRSVTIKAPQSRAAAVRRELVSAGVDESMITVEPTAGELMVDMAFNGVAASSEQYAAMWNGGPTLASTTPAPGNAAPGYAPGVSAPSGEQGYAPTMYQPDATRAPEAAPSTDETYDPATTL